MFNIEDRVRLRGSEIYGTIIQISSYTSDLIIKWDNGNEGFAFPSWLIKIDKEKVKVPRISYWK